MKKRIAAGIIASLLVISTGVAFASDTEKKNDVVLRDRHPSGAPADYTEVFKKEGTGNKNYLYTVSQVITSGGLYCTVITFASETAGSATCLQRGEVPNPEAFIVLDANRYPDGPPR